MMDWPQNINQIPAWELTGPDRGITRTYRNKSTGEELRLVADLSRIVSRNGQDYETYLMFEQARGAGASPQIWGNVFSAGQPLLIWGASGSGKSSIAIDLAWSWILAEPNPEHLETIGPKVIEWPVRRPITDATVYDRGVLYLALDRPQQLLELIELKGPDKATDAYQRMAVRTGVSTVEEIERSLADMRYLPQEDGPGLVILDCLEAFGDPEKQETGAQLRKLTQMANTHDDDTGRERFELIIVHHANGSGARMAGHQTLDNLAGGIIQIKPGKYQENKHTRGIGIEDRRDKWFDMPSVSSDLLAALEGGATAKEASERLGDGSDAGRQRALRRLNKLADEGLVKVEGDKPKRFFLA